MIKKNILHPTKRYKKAESETLNTNIELSENRTLLREGDKTIILDTATLFDKERNTSINYRIYGKLNMVFRNLYSGTTTYGPLEEEMFYLGDGLDGDYTGYLPYNEFAFLRDDYIREVFSSVDDTNGTYNPTSFVKGYSGHTTFGQLDAPFKNWNLYLTYVYGQDETYPMKYTLSGNTEYSFTASSGVPFRVSDEGSYFKLTSPVKHNMGVGEYVIISGDGLTSSELERTHPITYVGDEKHGSDEYVINLYKSDLSVGTSFPGVVFGVRCLDKTDITNTKSKYYVHKHKTLTEIGDYILDSSGFESPIFENERKLLYTDSAGNPNQLVHQNKPETTLFHFKNTISLSGITNNLGYTPTDVYVTTVFRNGNGYFNYPPKNGYRFHFHDLWSENHFGMTSSEETTIPSSTTTSNNGTTLTVGNPLPLGTILTGAFVEYNDREFKETIISESFHKISVNSDFFDHGQENSSKYYGSSPSNPAGYLYQPHQRVKLRQLSPYVETASTNNILDLPENTNYDEILGQWRWRDVYDHGYVDVDGNGTNFPFLNGQHYVKNDINFYLRNETSFTNKKDGIKTFTSDSDIC